LEADAPDFKPGDRRSAKQKAEAGLNAAGITQPGASLAFTVVFRLSDQETQKPTALYAPLCGLAVWQALSKDLGLHPLIKWPNDVLLNRRKCCGILTESSWLGNKLQGIVLGIGINITADSLPGSAQVPQFPATWIEAHASAQVDRFALLAAVLKRPV
jgi:BirA family biotin operon repressor/biotin-[acetyl-CoA-carboxylase] ligase